MAFAKKSGLELMDDIYHQVLEDPARPAVSSRYRVGRPWSQRLKLRHHAGSLRGAG